jgi:hypothetical protein
MRLSLPTRISLLSSSRYTVPICGHLT